MYDSIIYFHGRIRKSIGGSSEGVIVEDKSKSDQRLHHPDRHN